jgi:hypothetical protein
MFFSPDLLSAKRAARRLGISTSRLYEWFSLSDVGEFVLRGQTVTIEYFQGGAKGQGRIRIAAAEVERLIELTRVRQAPATPRRTVLQRVVYPGITVELGRPKTTSVA